MPWQYQSIYHMCQSKCIAYEAKIHVAAISHVRSFDDTSLVCQCMASGKSSNFRRRCTATVVSHSPVQVMQQLEGSGGSFTALLARAPTGKGGYIDSGDVLEEHERRAGGLRIRMKHYFKKQATQQSGPPVL